MSLTVLVLVALSSVLVVPLLSYIRTSVQGSKQPTSSGSSSTQNPGSDASQGPAESQSCHPVGVQVFDVFQTRARRKKATEKTPGPYASSSSLHAASIRGDVDAVRQHLAQGVPVDSYGPAFGCAPLHCAVMHRRKQAAQVLLAHGADACATDNAGLAPMDYATANCDAPMVRLLLRAGAVSQTGPGGDADDSFAAGGSSSGDGGAPDIAAELLVPNLGPEDAGGASDGVEGMPSGGLDTNSSSSSSSSSKTIVSVSPWACDWSVMFSATSNNSHSDSSGSLLNNNSSTTITTIAVTSTRSSSSLHAASCDIVQPGTSSPTASERHAPKGRAQQASQGIGGAGADNGAVAVAGSSSSEDGGAPDIELQAGAGTAVSVPAAASPAPAQATVTQSRLNAAAKSFVLSSSHDAAPAAASGSSSSENTSVGVAAAATCLLSSSSNSRDSINRLHIASIVGRTADVRQLLSEGVSADAPDGYGSSALHVAVRIGHVEVAAVLLAHGASVSADDSFGHSPLHTAVRHGEVEMAQLLLAHGADVSAQDRSGQTPLNNAVSNSDLHMTRLLIGRGAAVNGTSSAYGDYSILAAAIIESTGSADVVRVLLEAGAVGIMDPELDEEFGIDDALRTASMCDCPDVIRLLLKHTKQHTTEALQFLLGQTLCVQHYDTAAQLFLHLEQTQPSSGVSALHSQPPWSEMNPAAARLAVLKGWGVDTSDAQRAAATAQERHYAEQSMSVRELLVGLELTDKVDEGADDETDDE